jgi:uncharacterized lipoprotein YajG
MKILRLGGALLLGATMLVAGCPSPTPSEGTAAPAPVEAPQAAEKTVLLSVAGMH